ARPQIYGVRARHPGHGRGRQDRRRRAAGRPDQDRSRQHRRLMRVDLFDFELPSDRIALRPARPRDSARLLLVEGTVLSDRGVLDLPDILRPGDVLVFNDTRVIPAQLEGRRGEASVGATLHKREDLRSWWAFV